jgi:cation diffusion facilitator family transporter
MQPREGITRYAWLSILTAFFIIVLKVLAFCLTGSIGFLSDALESVANIFAAIITLIALIIAARPPDEEHGFGHTKVEYISSGVEGVLILVAAILIAVQAVQRLIYPQPLEQVGVGIFVSGIAALGNFIVARIILRAGEQHRSAALRADANHLLTDVWTSVGVILGVFLVGLTGWLRLDPIIGLLVAIQIIIMAIRLLKLAVNGLMDASLPIDEIAQIEHILDRFRAQGVLFHALRTREAGSQRFVSFHVQVPGTWSVQQGHELLEEIEYEIRQALNPVTVFTHLEPVEDPLSWVDTSLNRTD